MKKPWYEELFENYAEKYDNESFTQGTVGECDFIESEMNFDKRKRILDIGCGTGRHAIELARRGYSVTGIDLSATQLQRAKMKAMQAGVPVEFQQADARSLPFKNCFEGVIMLCEGGFSLMETDEMNFEILKNAANALKTNGVLIFTTLNGLFPLFHSVRDFLTKNNNADHVTFEKNSFDLMTFRNYDTISIEDDLGNRKELICNERHYVPSEITWLLKSLSFKDIHIVGARLGEFSRLHPLTTEDFEMLVIATKGGQ